MVYRTKGGTSGTKQESELESKSKPDNKDCDANCIKDQSDSVKSQISTLERKNQESNHVEVNNVISDSDAADFVDKLLMRINGAANLSEMKEEKNEYFKEKREEEVMQKIQKRRDV